MKKIYTAIDIGSDTIKFVVAEKYKDKLNILAIHEENAKGIRKGLIVDPNLAINSIKDGIKELEKMLNITINKVIVNIPDYNAKFMFVTGEIVIDNEEDVVTTDDVSKIKIGLDGKIGVFEPGRIREGPGCTGYDRGWGKPGTSQGRLRNH